MMATSVVNMCGHLCQPVLLFIALLSPTTTETNCNGTYCAINIDGAYPQILPRRAGRMAVAYDAMTDAILILGGGNSNEQYVTFNGSIFHDEGEYYMIDGVHGTGQYYSQLEDILWMINDNTPGFVTMNTETRAINYPSITIPTDVGTRGCLATMKYENNQYLFVVGGYNSNDGYLDLVQVYNITSQKWFNLPSIKTPRRSAACIIHNGILYVIGGKNDGSRVSSIESLDVANYLLNIANTQWIYTIANLNVPLDSCIAVRYGNDIIVFGGIDNNGILPTDMNVIDTNTNSVKVDGFLVRGVLNPAAIVVGDMLYGFGGTDINGVSDQYQYINLNSNSKPSSTPTSIPSLSPTSIPSSSPTSNPSSSPTSIPSSSPTSNPSSSPTLNPVTTSTVVPVSSTVTNSPTFVLTRVTTNIPIQISSTLNAIIRDTDSASGRVLDDISSTLSVENEASTKARPANQMLVVIIFSCIVVFCCVSAVILYLYLSRWRKQDNASKEVSNNVSIQLSKTVSGLTTNSNTNGVLSSSNLDQETYNKANSVSVIDVDSDIDMDVLNDIQNHMNTAGNDNCDAEDIDNIIINNNSNTAGFIDSGNNDDDDIEIMVDDDDVITPRFKSIANDEFIVETQGEIDSEYMETIGAEE